jgi:hypothetical protein
LHSNSGYPRFRSLSEIIHVWNPDHPDPVRNNLEHSDVETDDDDSKSNYTFYEVLQHFDFSNPTERALAEEYRKSEVPFKLYNVRELQAVSLKWSDSYLQANLHNIEEGKAPPTGDVMIPHTEESNNNHFLYWNYRRPSFKTDTTYKAPTELISIDFNDWLKYAKDADRYKYNSTMKHYYYMIGKCIICFYSSYRKGTLS